MVLTVPQTLWLATEIGSHTLSVAQILLNEISIAIYSTTISESQAVIGGKWKKPRIVKKKKTKCIVKLHNVWLLSVDSF